MLRAWRCGYVLVWFYFLLFYQVRQAAEPILQHYLLAYLVHR